MSDQEFAFSINLKKSMNESYLILDKLERALGIADVGDDRARDVIMAIQYVKQMQDSVRLAMRGPKTLDT